MIFGINKNEPELAEAINAAIKQAWKDCLNVKAMAKYGLGDKAWFVPPEKNPRIGVDLRGRLPGPQRRPLLLIAKHATGGIKIPPDPHPRRGY